MPTYTKAFHDGTNAIAPTGQVDYLFFNGTWLFADTFVIHGSGGISGLFTLGRGDLAKMASASVCITAKNRVYLGLGSQFNFCQSLDPTEWEEQGSSAGFVGYLTGYGAQDAINGLAILQGRLAVFGRRTVQVWSTDADPSLFSLVQALDNTGTKFPLSVQQLGDFDVLYLDDTGIRSLRTREVTLNSYVDDVGSPVDSFIRAALLTATAACGIVEPTTKNYWLHIGGTIYVFSRHPSSKVTAWSTYKPTYEVNLTPLTVNHQQSYGGLVVGRIYHYLKGDSDTLTSGTTTLSASGYFIADATTAIVAFSGMTTTATLSGQLTFTPDKFVVYNGQVYCRAGLELHRYGGSTNNVYDNTVVTVQTPWLDDKKADTRKQGTALNAVAKGAWTFSVGMDPTTNAFTQVVPLRGSASNPSALSDSTYEIGDFKLPGLKGTHFSILAKSEALSAINGPATLSSMAFHYNLAGIV